MNNSTQSETTEAKALRNGVYSSSENRLYIKQMLHKNWHVYIYRKGLELIPTGVIWNIGAPLYIIKPKQNEQ
jgi:hypothetical protein